MVNHKSIIYEGFNRYLDKVHKINSADKGSLHQWFQGILFLLYACTAGSVDVTNNSQSVVAIGREFQFLIDLSPSRSREVTSEVQQAFDNFEAASHLLFRQIYMFNILVSERRLRHTDLCNKGKLFR